MVPGVSVFGVVMLILFLAGCSGPGQSRPVVSGSWFEDQGFLPGFWAVGLGVLILSVGKVTVTHFAPDPFFTPGFFWCSLRFVFSSHHAWLASRALLRLFCAVARDLEIFGFLPVEALGIGSAVDFALTMSGLGSADTKVWRFFMFSTFLECWRLISEPLLRTDIPR